MRVFTTILLDSLRLLKARALFWVALGISALVALLFLSIGFTDQGVSVMFGWVEVPMEEFRRGSGREELCYLGIYSNALVGFWLSWGAIILALISCAPIFPDLMAEGSIGLALSKPPGRLKWFIYKYLGSLLFVALQATIFCVIALIAIRWRIGVWKLEVLWAVPLLVLVFSYLYSVVVLVGVRTRSVLAAILAGLLVWFFAWLAQFSESTAYQYAMGWADEGGTPSATAEQIHRATKAINAALPKTGETVKLIDRWMTVDGDKGLSNTRWVGGLTGLPLGEEQARQEAELQSRMTPGYIIGTSLVFELVMLTLAARHFRRRDF